MTKVYKKHLTPADAKLKVGTIVRCTTNAVLVTGKGNTKETGYPTLKPSSYPNSTRHSRAIIHIFVPFDNQFQSV